MPFPSRNPFEVLLSRRRLLQTLALSPWLGLAGCAPSSSSPLVGQMLPPLALPDLDGVLRAPFPEPGYPGLINVWATWCPPCRAEMAALDRLTRALTPRGLSVTAVTVDADLNLAREYLLASPPAFAVRCDPGGLQMSRMLGTAAIPATILVERVGRVRGVLLGEQAWDGGPARAAVEELIS